MPAVTPEEDVDPRTLHPRQGVTYRCVFTWEEPDGTPIDTAGYTGRVSLYSKAGGVEILELVGAPQVVCDGSEVTMMLTPVQTDGLSKDGYYEVDLVADDTEIVHLLSGRFNLIKRGEPYPEVVAA